MGERERESEERLCVSWTLNGHGIYEGGVASDTLLGDCGSCG
jgi:hypothetical protein